MPNKLNFSYYHFFHKVKETQESLGKKDILTVLLCLNMGKAKSERVVRGDKI